jgi:hypothetical protein
MHEALGYLCTKLRKDAFCQFAAILPTKPAG